MAIFYGLMSIIFYVALFVGAEKENLFSLHDMIFYAVCAIVCTIGGATETIIDEIKKGGY